jgi:hypothetical protein
VAQGCEAVGFCVPENEMFCGGFASFPCEDQNEPVCVKETGVSDAAGYCFSQADANCIKQKHPQCFD